MILGKLVAYQGLSIVKEFYLQINGRIFFNINFWGVNPAICMQPSIFSSKTVVGVLILISMCGKTVFSLHGPLPT